MIAWPVGLVIEWVQVLAISSAAAIAWLVLVQHLGGLIPELCRVPDKARQSAACCYTLTSQDHRLSVAILCS